MTDQEEEKERPQFGRHWGDWSGPIMALGFLAGFLALLFGPNPLEGLAKTDQVLNRIERERNEKAENAERQRELDADKASGVVTVGIAPPKKKP